MSNSTEEQLDLQISIAVTSHQKVVNVASVPKRSPFRYPGGKTWLIPYLRQWLNSLQTKPTLFLEPFAGGGIVSLTVAFENLAEFITMVELDQLVSSVWRTILGDEAEWLAIQIEAFELTAANVDFVLANSNPTARELAFQTILKNRVNRGGILAPGAGRLKEGESGKGLRSCWYPETLAQRIRDIGRVRTRIAFIEGDGLSVMRTNAHRQDMVVFIDPPYTASSKRAGSRLYNHSELDHNELFRITDTLKGDFLMTYDNAREVRHLATSYGFDTKPVAMKNTHHAKMSELLIGRNLDWLQNP